MANETDNGTPVADSDSQVDNGATSSTDLKQRSNKRRKMLGMIAAGGGVLASQSHLPQTWSRPVVESVVLPAHAAGSPTGSTTGTTTGTTAPTTQLSCSTITCIVTGWAGGPEASSFMGGSSSTTRQTTTSGGPNTSVGFITTWLTDTNFAPVIPYTTVFNRDANFSAVSCSGTSTISYTMALGSGTSNREISFASRVFTSNRNTASSLERMTVQDLGQFIFTATCAMQTTVPVSIGP